MISIHKGLIVLNRLLLLTQKFFKINFQYEALLAFVAQWQHISKNVLLIIPLGTYACSVKLSTTRPETTPYVFIVTHGTVIDIARHDSLT